MQSQRGRSGGRLEGRDRDEHSVNTTDVLVIKQLLYEMPNPTIFCPDMPANRPNL